MMIRSPPRLILSASYNSKIIHNTAKAQSKLLDYNNIFSGTPTDQDMSYGSDFKNNK